ncbi:MULTISPECIES: RnfH family protein [unclassified Psychrobacter]|uniref:RnfH family protein n=1 Tax=unclassified Psychrobacter TaxID=196806 RepID=UPI003FD118AD
MARGDTPHRPFSTGAGFDRVGIAVAELIANPITVYLAYAEKPQRQHYTTLVVEEGTTLYEALMQAGWLARFASLASWCEQAVDIKVPTAKRWHVGIYAQKQPLNYRLQPFDRIEVYRSLSADPMSQRKNKSRH